MQNHHKAPKSVEDLKSLILKRKMSKPSCLRMLRSTKPLSRSAQIRVPVKSLKLNHCAEIENHLLNSEWSLNVDLTCFRTDSNLRSDLRQYFQLFYASIYIILCILSRNRLKWLPYQMINIKFLSINKFLEFEHLELSFTFCKGPLNTVGIWWINWTFDDLYPKLLCFQLNAFR